MVLFFRYFNKFVYSRELFPNNSPTNVVKLDNDMDHYSSRKYAKQACREYQRRQNKSKTPLNGLRHNFKPNHFIDSVCSLKFKAFLLSIKLTIFQDLMVSPRPTLLSTLDSFTPVNGKSISLRFFTYPYLSSIFVSLD